jgi:hypothetical protein
MLHIDKQYTPNELRLEYAATARKMFDEHQKWRSRCILWNFILLFSAMVLSILVIRVPWCALALFGISFGILASNLTPKAVSHALSAMTCLRHAQTFEGMEDLDSLQRAIEAFEAETLHD